MHSLNMPHPKCRAHLAVKPAVAAVALDPKLARAAGSGEEGTLLSQMAISNWNKEGHGADASEKRALMGAAAAEIRSSCQSFSAPSCSPVLVAAVWAGVVALAA